MLDRAAARRGVAEDDIVALFAARGDDFAARVRGRRCAARERSTATRHLCRQPQHQLHQHLLLPLPVLRLLQGQAVGEPARAALRSDAATKSARACARRGSAARPKSACRAASIPTTPAQTYLDICRAVKDAAPDMHIHAFSPLEVYQGAQTLGLAVARRFLRELKGGRARQPAGHRRGNPRRRGARASSARTRSTTAQWLDGRSRRALRRLAHHRDHHVRPCRRPRHWARHLLRIRAPAGRHRRLHRVRAAAVRAHGERRCICKGRARSGPTFREAVLMHAVARLVLHPAIANIQASWVKMGPGRRAGLPPGRRQRSRRHVDEREHHPRRRGEPRPGNAPEDDGGDCICSAGRVPRQRTTTYGDTPAERLRQSSVPLRRGEGRPAPASIVLQGNSL